MKKNGATTDVLVIPPVPNARAIRNTPQKKKKKTTQTIAANTQKTTQTTETKQNRMPTRIELCKKNCDAAPKQNRIKTTPTAEEPPLTPANGYSLRREHVQRQAAPPPPPHERHKRNEEDDHPNLPEATAPETKPQLRQFVASDLLQDIPRFQPFQLLQYTFPVDKCTADKQDLAFYAHDSQPNVITQV